MTDSYWSLGDTFTEKGLRGRTFIYRLLDIEPHLRRSGAETVLLTWQGQCAICGEVFLTKSGRQPRYLVRTCHADRNTPRKYWPEVADG